MTPASKRRAKVAALIKSGMPAAEIAVRLDIPQRMVTNDAVKARKLGWLPPAFDRTDPRKRALNRMKYQMRLAGTYAGNMTDAFALLAPDAQDWLIEQTPKGCTIAEIIAGIITDAQQEEGA